MGVWKTHSTRNHLKEHLTVRCSLEGRKNIIEVLVPQLVFMNDNSRDTVPQKSRSRGLYELT